MLLLPVLTGIFLTLQGINCSVYRVPDGKNFSRKSVANILALSVSLSSLTSQSQADVRSVNLEYY